jgi:hypothetical protein
MNASADIQSAIAAPVLKRREKEMASDLHAGAAVTNGLCIFVMPPAPELARINAAIAKVKPFTVANGKILIAV